MQLPLNERLGHAPTLLVFACGHAFHRQCVPEGACVLCFQRDVRLQGSSIVGAGAGGSGGGVVVAGVPSGYVGDGR